MLVVFAGFAQTYYLKALSGTPTLPMLVHVHGLVMSAWFVVFAAQVWLVESHRVRLHRRLGLFGAALVVLIPILGIATAIEGARRHRHDPATPPAPGVRLGSRRDRHVATAAPVAGRHPGLVGFCRLAGRLIGFAPAVSRQRGRQWSPVPASARSTPDAAAGDLPRQD